MPLYEYQCDACGARFERIQKFSDPLVTVCPTCGGRVQKLISSPAFQFKGSGFYITDYARKGEDSTSKASGESTDARGSTDSKDSKDSKESKETKDSKKSNESKDSSDSSKESKKTRDGGGSSESKPAVSPTGTSGNDKS
jgi:putative FmdB family regulatory protein